MTIWNFYLQIFEKAVGKEEIITFHSYLLRYLKSPPLVVWDRLTAHRSRLVREFLGSLGSQIARVCATSPSARLSCAGSGQTGSAVQKASAAAGHGARLLQSGPSQLMACRPTLDEERLGAATATRATAAPRNSGEHHPERLRWYLLEFGPDGTPTGLRGDRYEFWIYRQVRKRLAATPRSAGAF
jgi:hypothetical protein